MRMLALNRGVKIGSVQGVKFGPAKTDLFGVQLLQPPKQVVETFMEYVQPMDAQIENLHRKNNRLVQARDLLLPLLMNGEIAV